MTPVNRTQRFIRFVRLGVQPALVAIAMCNSCAAEAVPRQSAQASGSVVSDPRHISNGWIIPSEGYADQPYIVMTDDAAWLCVMTTGKGVEGASGQHVISLRSTDRGRTWEQPVDIEPADGPEASYAVLLKVPSGRVYVFYNHNSDNVRQVKREDGGVYKRVDSLGHYVFKYTDDHGRTWSPRRFEVPVREFECDRQNVYGGKLRFFWNVGRPVVLGDVAICVLHKVGAMGPGFFAQSEGAFLKSRNILSERDPETITFETLPGGEVGLRTPPGGGRVAEEQSIVALSDGSLYCVYRTVDGWPACAYSRDGGHAWTPPTYACYTPGGRRMKHPRAANFVWRCSNGKYLYWFHNHGGSAIGNMAADTSGRSGSPYDDRNPAWLAAGVERDSPAAAEEDGKEVEKKGVASLLPERPKECFPQKTPDPFFTADKVIHWSQPEILLYDDDPFIRMSYPDLVEDSGKFYVTETQKNIGRVHEIPSQLLEGLFNQWDSKAVAAEGLVLNLPGDKPMPREAAMPRLPDSHTRDNKRPDYGGKDLRAGFSLDLWLQLDWLAPGQVLLDSRDDRGKGILLSTADNGTIKLTLNDGRSESSWDCDRGVLQADTLHHVVIIVDGGPKIIMFVVDGVLCDGGPDRQFGWGRFSPTQRAPNGSPSVKLGPSVRSLRIYSRALRTSEAVGNFRARR